MADPTSIYESVLAEQEKFSELSRQLDAERRTVANQLEKVRLSRDSGMSCMSGSGYLDEHANQRGWNANQTIPEDYENDACLDPVLVNRKVDTKVDKKVYRSERIQRRVIGDPGYCAEGSFYEPRTEVPIHESRYTTTQSSSQPDADQHENGSSGSDPNLVSRNTSSTTTQEVTTVTKVYRTYERVPNESLSSNRDYDYPDEYIGDYEASSLYAKPYRKYGSPKRFDYVNGYGAHHANAGLGLNGGTNGNDVYDAAEDLYANGLTSASPSAHHPHHQHPAKGPNRKAPAHSLLPDYDAGYMEGDYSRGSPSLTATATVPDSAAMTVVPTAQYRDPELAEVVEFLRSSSNVIKANAAAHLAHLAFMNDQVKNLTRQLNGIPPLVEMLQTSIPEIQRNACSALRNLSFGRGNDENKRAIRNAGGLMALVKLLKQSQESDTGELVTAILWILSSCDDLKKPILDEACPLLVRQTILPQSKAVSQSNGRVFPYGSTVFRNATGVLRNISSAGFYARKNLRESEDLIDGLLHLLKSAVNSQDIDNKSIENVVCVLRNLSYRCQEVEDPDYDKKKPPTRKKNDKGSVSAPGSLNGTPNKNTTYAHLKGIELLWHIDNVKCYLGVLSNCANPDALEAAAGILQNLSACYWQPAIDIRAAVRKEKGLPILVELLRMEDDKVVCSVARALRNLAVDQRNRELIGKYAMRDLTAKIPSGTPEHHELIAASDETIAAVLATINEVVRKHQEFARSFLDVSGVERLVHITTNYNQYSSKVVRFAFLVLQTLWAHHGLHDVYKAAGWKSEHFLSKPPNMTVKTLGGSDTLGRTFSSQGPTKFEDKTLPRGTLPPGAVDEQGIPMNVLTSTRTHNGTRSTEPVYAQVNRAEKARNRQSQRENGHGTMSANSGNSNLEDEMGGDSWV